MKKLFLQVLFQLSLKIISQEYGIIEKNFILEF